MIYYIALLYSYIQEEAHRFSWFVCIKYEGDITGTHLFYPLRNEVKDEVIE